MSGFSDSTHCPNPECDNTSADLYTDWKPFNYSSIGCLKCGLSIQPELSYHDFEELNEIRQDQDLEPLTEKPKQNKEIW